MAGGINRISTHVLDTALGKPVPRVPVRLEQHEKDGRWVTLGSFITDADGRCAQMLAESQSVAEGYTASFSTREATMPLRMSRVLSRRGNYFSNPQGRIPIPYSPVVEPQRLHHLSRKLTQWRN